MNRAFVPLAFFGLGCVAAGCGGGGSTPIGRINPTGAPSVAPTVAGSNAPASVAEITPGPGLPTTLPIGANTAGPAALVSPSPIELSPQPAPNPSDVAAVNAGQVPSQAYFERLITPNVATPLPGTPRGVFGTIAGFLSDGFVFNISPVADASATKAAGALAVTEYSVTSLTQLDVHLSGQTFDLVPGGFGTLHVGDPLFLVLSDATSNPKVLMVLGNGSTAQTMAERAASREAQLDDWIARADASARARQRLSNPATTRSRDDENQNVSIFSVERASPVQSLVAVSPPGQLSPLGCITRDVTFDASIGLGSDASYPMEIQDVSDPNNFPESQQQALPIRVVALPATGQAYTYRFSYGIGGGLSGYFDFSQCPYAAQVTSLGFPMARVSWSGVSAGQLLYGESLQALPGSGQLQETKPTQCPFIPIVITMPVDVLLNFANSPSFSLCADWKMTGAPLGGTGTITNATIVSAPDSFDTTSWELSFDTSTAGDPSVQYVPNAAPDATAQPNVVTLTNVTYPATLSTTYSIALSIFLNGNPLLMVTEEEPTIFQVDPPLALPPFQSIAGVTLPSAPQITLYPQSGGVNVRGQSKYRSARSPGPGSSGRR